MARAADRSEVLGLVMEMRVTSYGLEQIENVMRGLPDALIVKIFTDAGLDVARQVGHRVERNPRTPRLTGQLLGSFSARRSTRTNRSSHTVRSDDGIGLAYLRGAPHLHLVELGTRTRRTRRGKNRGRVKGKRFLEQSTRSTPIQNIFETALSRKIDKVVKELAAGEPRKDTLRALGRG